MSNDDICYLPATEVLKLFRKKKLSPVELLKALAARSEKVNPKINCFADRYLDEALAQAKASEARYMKRGAKTAAARWHSAGREGRPARGRQAHHPRLAHLQGHRGRSLRPDDRAAAAGRRHHLRAHHHAGVLPLRDHRIAHLGRHPQSVEHRLGPGRLVRRFGRGAGGRPDDARDRHRHRRLDPHSGIRLRCRRLQAAAWPQSRWPAVQLRPLQPLRSHDPHRGGCRADAEHHVGAASAGSRFRSARR